jgi:hypothetical protein
MALSPVLVNVVVAVTEPPVTIGGAATLSAWLAVTNVRQGMGVPAGWTAQPTSPTTFAVVAPHSSAHTTWQITTTTSPGSYSLSASASYHGARSGTATGTATVQVQYASLAAAYDNRGVTDDANPAAGAFASSGKTHSAQAVGHRRRHTGAAQLRGHDVHLARRIARQRRGERAGDRADRHGHSARFPGSIHERHARRHRHRLLQRRDQPAVLAVVLRLVDTGAHRPGRRHRGVHQRPGRRPVSAVQLRRRRLPHHRRQCPARLALIRR